MILVVGGSLAGLVLVLARGRLAMLRHTVLGAPPPPSPSSDDRITFDQLRVYPAWLPAQIRALSDIISIIGSSGTSGEG